MQRLAILVVLASCAAKPAPAPQCPTPPPPEKPDTSELDQVKADLEAAQNSLADKNKLITTLQDENAALMRAQNTPATPPPIDAQSASDASKKFLAVASASKAAIQKCYKQVLKKDPTRTIKLTVIASFTAAGALDTVAMSPKVDDEFDTCVEAVGKTWKLDALPSRMSFKFQYDLKTS